MYMSEQAVDMPVNEARKDLADVLNAASVRGRITYITSRGRRVAAVVPLTVAERAEEEATNVPNLSATESRLAAAIAAGDVQAMPAIAAEYEAAGLTELGGLLRTKPIEQLRGYLDFLTGGGAR